MKYLLSIILSLWCGYAWAFPPGFVAKLGAIGGSFENSDTFTDADGTLLSTHNSSWGNIGAYAVSLLHIDSNTVRATAYEATGGRYTTSTSDISQIVVKAQTGSGAKKFVHVRSSGSSRGYHAHMAAPSGSNWTNVELYKDSTYLTECVISCAYTSDHTIKITASGVSTVTITVFLDGLQVCQTTDSSAAISSGNPGFSIWGDSYATGNSVDSWQDY